MDFQSPVVHWMTRTSSCLSCRNPCKTPHSLNAFPLFIDKPFFYWEVPLRRIPFPTFGSYLHLFRPRNSTPRQEQFGVSATPFSGGPLEAWRKTLWGRSAPVFTCKSDPWVPCEVSAELAAGRPCLSHLRMAKTMTMTCDPLCPSEPAKYDSNVTHPKQKPHSKSLLPEGASDAHFCGHFASSGFKERPWSRCSLINPCYACSHGHP